MTVQVLEGHCLDVLRTLPAESVHCCVTSPPYYALRDYGVDGQIGLEETPAAFIAALVDVFREVRRVLRDDGTLWMNLGDSYAAGGMGAGSGKQLTNRGTAAGGHMNKPRKAPEGLKPKDLVGIPWRVAFALQQPYYTGRIRDVMDRIWLAAMIDAEGCFFIHKRKAGTSSGAKFTRADGSEVAYDRVNDTFSPGVEVCNTHPAIVQRCMEIAGVGSMSVQQEGRKQTLYRWTARGEEARMVAREVYPHLVGKMQQARIVAGCPTSGDKAAAGHEALKGLHHGTATDVDFGAPASPLEPGWYLRQDVIWAKPNPMPESIRDRCTKAHEYIFLMSKSARYWFDADAIKEPAVAADMGAMDGGAQRMPDGSKANDGRNFRVSAKGNAKTFRGGRYTGGQSFDNSGSTERDSHGNAPNEALTRNRRSVWTVATEPFKEAHFATFPPSLIVPCIAAGCPPGGTVLDPFGGAGTTGLVADRLQRNAVLIELNPTYAEMARRRIHDDAPLLQGVA